jgi:hypothetical protein
MHLIHEFVPVRLGTKESVSASSAPCISAAPPTNVDSSSLWFRLLSDGSSGSDKTVFARKGVLGGVTLSRPSPVPSAVRSANSWEPSKRNICVLLQGASSQAGMQRALPDMLPSPTSSSRCNRVACGNVRAVLLSQGYRRLVPQRKIEWKNDDRGKTRSGAECQPSPATKYTFAHACLSTAKQAERGPSRAGLPSRVACCVSLLFLLPFTPPAQNPPYPHLSSLETVLVVAG